jgi:hypothetical protein
MDDPHIRAFTILSDRVSTVEEMVREIHERERRKELMAMGELDHTFLRFPFALRRWPASHPSHHQSYDVPAREEGKMPRMVKMVIFQTDSYDIWGHGDHCADDTVFTPEEVARIIAC